jgi:hypothetical protein
MPEKSLKIDELLLDLVNPRTREVQSQRDALQGVISDQKNRLTALAEDIAEHGLNPADRLLVMHQRSPKGYVTLEGNRRVATLQILKNPAVLSGLTVTPAMRKRLEAASKKFSASKVEPIPCFSFVKREDARRWIEMRHTGQGAGEGIVGWSGIATARFRGSSPALQAIDLVKRFGTLTDDERDKIESISISVIDRIMGSKALKDAIGVKTSKDILYSLIRADELIKPLTYLIRQILNGNLTNRTINTKKDQSEFIKKIPSEFLPDLTQTIDETPADSFTQSDFSSKPKKRSKRSPSVQKTIWPRSFNINASVDRVTDIFKELKILEVEKCKNSISVLMRIILEMSADEYMDNNNISRRKGPPAYERDKTLSEKVSEVCAHLISSGVKKHKLSPVTKSINNPNSPLFHDLLNQYVHNAYHNPSPGELRSGASTLKVFLEHVWP